MYSSIVRLPGLHRTVRKTYTLENMDGAGNSFSLVRLTLMSINGVMHALQPHCFRGERIFIILHPSAAPRVTSTVPSCRHVNMQTQRKSIAF